jgi:3-oxoacyl-[acyl-carrier-protein] synthase III
VEVRERAEQHRRAGGVSGSSSAGICRIPRKIVSVGREVFKFAARILPEMIEWVMNLAEKPH